MKNSHLSSIFSKYIEEENESKSLTSISEARANNSKTIFNKRPSKIERKIKLIINKSISFDINKGKSIVKDGFNTERVIYEMKMKECLCEKRNEKKKNNQHGGIVNLNTNTYIKCSCKYKAHSIRKDNKDSNNSSIKFNNNKNKNSSNSSINSNEENLIRNNISSICNYQYNKIGNYNHNNNDYSLYSYKDNKINELYKFNKNDSRISFKNMAKIIKIQSSIRKLLSKVKFSYLKTINQSIYRLFIIIKKIFLLKIKPNFYILKKYSSIPKGIRKKYMDLFKKRQSKIGNIDRKVYKDSIISKKNSLNTGKNSKNIGNFNKNSESHKKNNNKKDSLFNNDIIYTDPSEIDYISFSPSYNHCNKILYSEASYCNTIIDNILNENKKNEKEAKKTSIDTIINNHNKENIKNIQNEEEYIIKNSHTNKINQLMTSPIYTKNRNILNFHFKSISQQLDNNQQENIKIYTNSFNYNKNNKGNKDLSSNKICMNDQSLSICKVMSFKIIPFLMKFKSLIEKLGKGRIGFFKFGEYSKYHYLLRVFLFWRVSSIDYIKNNKNKNVYTYRQNIHKLVLSILSIINRKIIDNLLKYNNINIRKSRLESIIKNTSRQRMNVIKIYLINLLNILKMKINHIYNNSENDNQSIINNSFNNHKIVLDNKENSIYSFSIHPQKDKHSYLKYKISYNNSLSFRKKENVNTSRKSLLLYNFYMILQYSQLNLSINKLNLYFSYSQWRNCVLLEKRNMLIEKNRRNSLCFFINHINIIYNKHIKQFKADFIKRINKSNKRYHLRKKEKGYLFVNSLVNIIKNSNKIRKINIMNNIILFNKESINKSNKNKLFLINLHSFIIIIVRPIKKSFFVMFSNKYLKLNNKNLLYKLIFSQDKYNYIRKSHYQNENIIYKYKISYYKLLNFFKFDIKYKKIIQRLINIYKKFSMKACFTEINQWRNIIQNINMKEILSASKVYYIKNNKIKYLLKNTLYKWKNKSLNLNRDNSFIKKTCLYYLLNLIKKKKEERCMIKYYFNFWKESKVK